jgi:putative serine protease PepD
MYSSDDDRTLPRLLPGAYLGVAVDPTPNDTGATITDVGADSPADDAGLREGDVITAVDDTDITSALDLVREIRAHDVDDTVTITYTRDGTSSTAEVTLTSRPASQPVS